MTDSTPPELLSKLTSLDTISQDSITSCLRDRFDAGLPYTSLSDSVLVSINPFASVGNRNTDETLREYTRDYRLTEKSARAASLPPHIFGLACDAYFYMSRTGQDQSILLR